MSDNSYIESISSSYSGGSLSEMSNLSYDSNRPSRYHSLELIAKTHGFSRRNRMDFSDECENQMTCEKTCSIKLENKGSTSSLTRTSTSQNHNEQVFGTDDMNHVGLVEPHFVKPHKGSSMYRSGIDSSEGSCGLCENSHPLKYHNMNSTATTHGISMRTRRNGKKKGCSKAIWDKTSPTPAEEHCDMLNFEREKSSTNNAAQMSGIKYHNHPFLSETRNETTSDGKSKYFLNEN